MHKSFLVKKVCVYLLHQTNKQLEIMTNEEIIKANSQYELIGENAFGSPIFLVEEFEFGNYDVQLVKIQWSKTQAGYSYRVPNFLTGRRNELMVPVQGGLRSARKFIQSSIESGTMNFWTGHVAVANK